jgi:hypothetical protein
MPFWANRRADAEGREVDVHSYTLDEHGNNVYGVPYIGDQLTGKGVINGYVVRCISPEWPVKFHTGYQLDENDFHEVQALCQGFQIALPDELRKFMEERKCDYDTDLIAVVQRAFSFRHFGWRGTAVRSSCRISWVR